MVFHTGRMGSFSDDFVMATGSPEKLTLAGGFRYMKAMRPQLYKDIIGKAHAPEQKVSWLNQAKRTT